MDRHVSLDVYVITSSELVAGRGHREVALAAIEGGAAAVQLRAPELDDDSLLPIATELALECWRGGVVFVVNDRLEVALESGAAGVHLGQADELAGARRRVGADRVLGISVGAVDQAVRAEAAGADYLGVTVWATATKPEAVPQGLGSLREIANATSLPVLGVGGIDASNARDVLDAGAAGVAVLSAVGAAEDPVAATRQIAAAVRSRAEN